MFSSIWPALVSRRAIPSPDGRAHSVRGGMGQGIGGDMQANIVICSNQRGSFSTYMSKAKSPKPNKPKLEVGEPFTTLPISRDRNFVRLTADDVVVVDRGPDLELSFLIHERFPTEISPEDGLFGTLDGDYLMKAGISEIGKVRLQPNAAVSLAMNILDTSASAGRINIPAFMSAIERMVASAEEAEQAEQASGSDTK